MVQHSRVFQVSAMCLELGSVMGSLFGIVSRRDFEAARPAPRSIAAQPWPAIQQSGSAAGRPCLPLPALRRRRCIGCRSPPRSGCARPCRSAPHPQPCSRGGLPDDRRSRAPSVSGAPGSLWPIAPSWKLVSSPSWIGVVGADHRSEPCAGARPQPDVTDQIGGRSDPGAVPKARRNPVDFIEWHDGKLVRNGAAVDQPLRIGLDRG